MNCGVWCNPAPKRNRGYMKLTTYEIVERVVFLLAMIVLLLDVFIWRP